MRMTIIVSVEFNDGIVVASDSTTSFFRNDQRFVESYDNASKIFNLCKGLPVGAATCGAGNIGSASISTLSKDLRERFQGNTKDYVDWKLDRNNYTMEAIAGRARELLLSAAQEAESPIWLTYWVFGYSSRKALPELF
jgi:20S proteasome alpha/beta subunit